VAVLGEDAEASEPPQVEASASSAKAASFASTWSSVTKQESVRKMFTKATPGAVSKLSGPASMATAAANGHAAAMGAAVRFGNRMRSAATGNTAAASAGEMKVDNADVCVESALAEAQAAEDDAPVSSVDANESAATTAPQADAADGGAVAALGADSLEFWQEADVADGGAVAVPGADSLEFSQVAVHAAEDGAADRVGVEDVGASEPQVEASTSEAGKGQDVPLPPQTGAAEAPPQPWLLKAQARSGAQAMPEDFSKPRESDLAVEEQAAVV